MRLSYNRLWKLLIDRNMSRQDLRGRVGLSASTMAKLAKGDNVNTATLVRICQTLECDIADITNVVGEPLSYEGMAKADPAEASV